MVNNRQVWRTKGRSLLLYREGETWRDYFAEFSLAGLLPGEEKFFLPWLAYGLGSVGKLSFFLLGKVSFASYSK